MKVFITGISGFIGFHLALHLKKMGCEVHGCDNFTPYYFISLKKGREEILKQENIIVRQADIVRMSELKAIFERESFDCLVHLAAQPGVRYSITHPDSYIQTNIVGFYHILEICRKYPAMKLIYASSSSVYGLNSKIPYAEKDKADRPASLYGATKKANEVIAYSYHHLYKIPMTGLRFFTVYGPWGRPDMAYYSFTKAILEEKPIELYNYGNVRRDFTYVDDIVRGIYAAMQLEGNAEIFNLGNQRSEPVSRMIEILEDLLGKKAKIEMRPLAQGDVVETFADLSHSAKKLNFQPAFSLEEGLKHFVSWYKSYNKANASGKKSIRSVAIKQ